MSTTTEDGYAATYPEQDSAVTAEMKTMLTNFYRTSDRAEANEEWIDYFTQDARVIMDGEEAVGKEEIRELRRKMWTKARERKHSVARVFPGRFDAEGDWEAMLMGEVRLRIGEGDESLVTAVVPWAAHAVLRREGDGQWRFARYRVWLQWHGSASRWVGETGS
ncbi:hypothetical protein XA68_12308 [Ophiocordyceps unilateralis]|uniref:SnoaL-like domain-containing protein n=1 Tax=Ophiocordyceps unilateralis TaxID=268505 RepID=A0A2A9PEY1_OPHUN|nr:hypothetical protein XA68_12308 [Ophiocordyceps unilateralis]